MISIDNYKEIGRQLPKLNETFIIKKGKRTGMYKIIESKNFEGCFDLILRVNMGYNCGTYVYKEKHIGGSTTIENCTKSAYDHT